MGLKKWIRLLPEGLRHRWIRSSLDLGSGAPANIVFKLAETQDELEQAFRVLHDAYVEQGFMDPHPSGLRVTKYHALPTTAVLIAKDTETNTVMGTISIIRDTPLGLPLDSAFSLQDVKKKFHHVAEVSSLAIRKDCRRRPADLLWPLLRYFYRYAKNVMKLDAYVIGVNPNWHDLYTGILGFEKLQGLEASEYGFVKNAPVAVYMTDLTNLPNLFYKQYSHLGKQANWHEYCVKQDISPTQHLFPSRKYDLIQNTVMTRDLFEYFFSERTDALSLFSHQEKRIIQNYYPKSEGYSRLIFGENVLQMEKSRRSHRFLARLDAQVMSEHSPLENHEVSILDFCQNGLKVESKKELPTEMDLQIRLGAYEIAITRVRVRRRPESHQYGLEILRFDKAWSNFIRETQNLFVPAKAKKEVSLKKAAGGVS